MSVELVTGYYGVGEDGEPNRHVSSAEDGARQAGTVGLGCYALSTGSKLSATMEDANTLVVADGDVMMNGRHVSLPDATSFTIPTGVQGQKVSNLAVLRYEKAADSVESVTPLVLTGEPSADAPTDPGYNSGSILDGDSPVDMPLYRVITDGINADDPEPLFDVLTSMAELRDLVSQLKVPYVTGGIVGATNSLGVIVCNPSPPAWAGNRKPNIVLATAGPFEPGDKEYQALRFTAVVWSIDSPSQVQIRVRREDTREWAANQGIDVMYAAIWLP